MLLVALEPEEESPILFLRLRKAARRVCRCFRWPRCVSNGLRKMSGTLIGAAPGTEPAVLVGLAGETVADDGVRDAAERNSSAHCCAPRCGRAGRRARRADPGLLTAVGDLVDATGAPLAWVPRRAGDRGALDAGALATLLPGGRPVADPAARAEVEAAWGASIPRPGRDTAGILDAVGIADGTIRVC